MQKLLIYFMVLLGSCSAREASTNASIEFLPPKKLAELKNKKLKEVSGIAASINNPNLLWVHNDKGNNAEIFLLDENLDVKLVCILEGIENRDWEDIAIGPGPDPNKRYLYVADIGDNDAQYEFKYVYRFEEPTWRDGGAERISISSFDKITFQLPDQRKDTEALLINPLTRDLYVISKEENPVHVYELKYPYSTQETLTASKIATLPFSKVVAGNFSSDGNEILIKTYKNIFYWKMTSEKSVAEVLKEPAQKISYEEEPQGEAIAWSHNNKGFYTLSEKTGGKKSFLYYYERKK